jgi:hypothetical protein
MLPATIEYGDSRFQDNKSITTVLHAAATVRKPGLILRLEHISAGYEIAGSAGRWTNECWAVRFDADACVHGRRFASEDAAVAHYNFNT